MNSENFKSVERSIGQLIDGINTHRIALPDLQRPYVWDRSRVRDLFDSLFREYPTGLLLFLENETERKNKSLGRKDDLIRIPNYVVIDWQQRLTSLYAVFSGHAVIGKDQKPENITLSFNPLTAQFSVADASTEKGYDWIYDIKGVLIWDDIFNLTSKYIESYRERYGQNTEKEKEISKNIQKLFSLRKYTFTVIEISKNLNIEEVSEIFLRINSKGKVLNNSDFILTLMSVYWEEGRKQIEAFSNWTREKMILLNLKLMKLWEFSFELDLREQNLGIFIIF